MTSESSKSQFLLIIFDNKQAKIWNWDSVPENVLFILYCHRVCCEFLFPEKLWISLDLSLAPSSPYGPHSGHCSLKNNIFHKVRPIWSLTLYYTVCSKGMFQAHGSVNSVTHSQHKFLLGHSNLGIHPWYIVLNIIYRFLPRTLFCLLRIIDA